MAESTPGLTHDTPAPVTSHDASTIDKPVIAISELAGGHRAVGLWAMLVALLAGVAVAAVVELRSKPAQHAEFLPEAP